MENDINKADDPRYAPPYPQNFHTFWPKHVIKAGSIVVSIIALIMFLAYKFSLPTDINMPPLPDDGMYIPGPEWLYLFFLQPFWYLTGNMAKYRFIATFFIPSVFLALVILIPLLLKKMSAKGIVWRLSAFLPFMLIGASIIYSGYPAKLYGCPSCHNPMMGERQALPPMNVAEFYKTERQMQIDVGKYRASKTDTEGGDVRGEVETYKDANWQMRHIYEPTFTW